MMSLNVKHWKEVEIVLQWQMLMNISKTVSKVVSISTSVIATRNVYFEKLLVAEYH